MDADWSVEIGGGALVMEAEWAGYVDLRAEPGRVLEIAEAQKFAALANLLLRLNGPAAGLWSAKCDVWTEETGELCCYVDVLPVAGRVFGDWRVAEAFCRTVVERLGGLAAGGDPATLELVVRAAVAGVDEGFGVTAYLSAGTEAALAAAMDAFADAALAVASRAGAESQLQ